MCLNVDESVLPKAFREITHQGIAPLVASMSVNDPAVNDPDILARGLPPLAGGRRSPLAGQLGAARPNP